MDYMVGDAACSSNCNDIVSTKHTTQHPKEDAVRLID